MEETQKYYYQIAGINIHLDLPVKCNVRKLLPTFEPFRTASYKENQPNLILSVGEADSSMYSIQEKKGKPISVSNNDLGHLFVYDGIMAYVFHLRTSSEGPKHCLTMSKMDAMGVIEIDFSDPLAGKALTSFIRITFSLFILKENGMLIHASAVELNGEAFLFMGKSGTGKSTHSMLWQQCFPSCNLLNDDNPAVRITGGKVMAFGTPWSGKTPCYKNKAYPVKGMVLLEQAKANHFTQLKGIEAFIAILPSCSVIQQDELLHDLLCNTLTWLIEGVTVGKLQCLPNEAAARLCAVHLIKQE